MLKTTTKYNMCKSTFNHYYDAILNPFKTLNTVHTNYIYEM